MTEKRCVICKQYKLASEFNLNKSKKDGLNLNCKVCSRIKSKEYYQLNKVKHKAVVKAHKALVVQQNRQSIIEYLQQHPCVDCGEDDIVVLEFDHLENKRGNISVMISTGCAWPTILKEIAKCEVRCANCHRRKTAYMFGWYRINGPQALK